MLTLKEEENEENRSGPRTSSLLRGQKPLRRASRGRREIKGIPHATLQAGREEGLGSLGYLK